MQLEYMIMLFHGLLLLIWVALPMLPAILIYKLFPDTHVAVNGPLAALTVRATGAFAGYLVVFAALFTIVDRTQSVISGFQKAYWTVNAKVIIQDDDQHLTRKTHTDDLIASIKPDIYHIANNEFSIKVPESEQLPFLILTIPNFGKKAVNLREGELLEKDAFHRTINFKEPIIIRRSD